MPSMKSNEAEGSNAVGSSTSNSLASLSFIPPHPHHPPLGPVLPISSRGSRTSQSDFKEKKPPGTLVRSKWLCISRRLHQASAHFPTDRDIKEAQADAQNDSTGPRPRKKNKVKIKTQQMEHLPSTRYGNCTWMYQINTLVIKKTAEKQSFMDREQLIRETLWRWLFPTKLQASRIKRFSLGPPGGLWLADPEAGKKKPSNF